MDLQSVLGLCSGGCAGVINSRSTVFLDVAFNVQADVSEWVETSSPKLENPFT